MAIDFVFEEELVEEAEASQGGSFGVLETGVYPVTINFAALDKTAKGNNTLRLDITTDTGHNTTLWRVFGTIDKTWASGKENFGYKTFQSLMAACGAKSITPVEFQLKKADGTPVQKDGRDVILSVIKELHGSKCVLAIQKELDVYNGVEKEQNIIHSCYNAKGQTYLEAKTNANADKVEKVKERLKDKETTAYKNKSQVPFAEEEEEEAAGGLL